MTIHVTVTCFISGQHCRSGDASGPEVSQALCAASRTGENYIGDVLLSFYFYEAICTVLLA